MCRGKGFKYYAKYRGHVKDMCGLLDFMCWSIDLGMSWVQPTKRQNTTFTITVKTRFVQDAEEGS
jgi:hypothetical protein